MTRVRVRIARTLRRSVRGGSPDATPWFLIAGDYDAERGDDGVVRVASRHEGAADFELAAGEFHVLSETA